MDYPELEQKAIDDIVAEVIDDLPDELTDRNSAAVIVKTIEAMAVMYGAMKEALNFWPIRLEHKILELLGVTPEEAKAATVEVEFTAASEDGAMVPSGTVVKTGTGVDAIRFETDEGIQASDFEENDDGDYVATVDATAEEPGEDGNVPAGAISRLAEPVSGIDSVTNPASAFGGQDEETMAALRERVPLAIRVSEYAITHEEFRYWSSQVSGVERAHSIGGQGFVTMHILANDLNEEPSEGLQEEVEEELLSRTIPGVEITVNQFDLRLVRIPEIEAELDDDADATEVAEEVEEVLEEFLTAVDLYEDDGRTKRANAWPWGRSLHLHDIIARLADVDGIERIESVDVEYSDDYGETWNGPESLDEVQAAADGTENGEFGLLHLDDDHPALTISEA